jgi:hypothetical protein
MGYQPFGGESWSHELNTPCLDCAMLLLQGQQGSSEKEHDKTWPRGFRRFVDLWGWM